ncbi:hypothetical protein BTO19_25185 [Vibrio parahaemolyticus]|uniref:hypothetical protein n=1 Tax=Vibrio parahaemolyticus TaxID=670 RepID=UPI000A39352B|nr:hypothetical protein [Vibrio parahaemolyticus]MVB83347.1 hypothetical protein [Vibrio cholerae]MVC72956.1 hypothetical protein [Vibrio cholerae]OUJ22002.1 hypothetical protein BTO19_25185 [Vibrio parahaemolyticus]TBT60385.1 hypothetical protein D5E77_25190 [Vibrio parahaemolyticus]HCG7362904.1 hypothetical protein [Vibrio parahaemolyticus]
MNTIDREAFGRDPFGYGAGGVFEWQMIEAMHSGGDFDPFKVPENKHLKSPILWLTQAEALSQAAHTLFKNEPEFETMPVLVRSICDRQYCGVGLMLLGYSLEIVLKAMLIMKHGVDGYTEIEKKHRHHRLHDLVNIIPNMDKRERAVLRGLTHFVYWAGRYPDPGTDKGEETLNIFELSEKYKISAHMLFTVSAKVMSYAHKISEETT